MTERIDDITYEENLRPTMAEPLENNLFISSPGEYLVEVFASELKKDAIWEKLFNGMIEPYERMDFSFRSLPAMRIYVPRYSKQGETWYENGDLLIDIIWPASIRRSDLTRLPTTVAGAIVQQLRRPTFFNTMCDSVPGLNEFGKTVDVDFTLGYQWQDDIVPLTRIKANYRINLNEWDEYLESDYRTKDDPFVRTLSDLTRLVTTVDALRSSDPEDVELEIDVDQTL